MAIIIISVNAKRHPVMSASLRPSSISLRGYKTSLPSAGILEPKPGYLARSELQSNGQCAVFFTPAFALIQAKVASLPLVH